MSFLFFLVLGFVVGSFLNVVALRLEEGSDFVRGRSACPGCHTVLAWYDNIPLLSFVWLLGKCRACRMPISWRYPLVECATGVIYAGTFWIFFNPFETSAWIETVWMLGLFSFFIVIALYDGKTMEIPVFLLQASALWTLVALFLLDWHLSPDVLWSLDGRLVSGILGALVAWAFFAALAFFSGETWMGWGDAWLSAIVGLGVGITGVLSALTLSFGAGAVFACVLLFRKQAGMKTQVPFGPFLVIGTIGYFFLLHLDIVRYGGYSWMRLLF